MSAYMRGPVVRTSACITRGGARGWGWYHRALKKINAPAAGIVRYDAALPSPPAEPRPKAFFEISIGGAATQRLVLELAQDIVPKTVRNFLTLCTEGTRVPPEDRICSYKHSKIHNVTKGVYVVGGDIVAANGTGGHAALQDGQRYFEHENFALQFSEPGVIGMANAGVHKNGSQFFIALRALPHLNGRNVAFGKVVQGLEVLKGIEAVYCVRGKPVTEIEIVNCGVVES